MRGAVILMCLTVLAVALVSHGHYLKNKQVDQEDDLPRGIKDSSFVMDKTDANAFLKSPTFRRSWFKGSHGSFFKGCVREECEENGENNGSRNGEENGEED
eukprot:gene402-10069_t